MKLSHKNRDRHVRRVAGRIRAKSGLSMPLAAAKTLFFVGQAAMLRSKEYGVRYENRKVVIAMSGTDEVMVSVPGRKSLMSVLGKHLELVAAK